MFSVSRALVAGALLAASASAGDHFILTQVRTLEYSRLDPLMNPGTNGPHAHHILGGSAFSANSGSPDVLEKSKCSSSLVGDDKSSYWAPIVYHNHGNGSYTPLVGQTRIYYFMKPGNGTKPVIAFPRGHRMLAGPPADKRPDTYPPRGELGYDQLQAMDPRVAAIKWGCGSGSGGGGLPGQRPYLPNDAPTGCGVLNAGIFFPSCGDGRLDSDDHFSHMSYPLDDANGFNCPPSHPIKYPTMFMENFYYIPANLPYRGANQDNWVLSNGDTLGLTFHADFINGWMPGVLEATMDQCNTPNAPETELQNCAPLAKSLSIPNANDCRSEGDIVAEDVGLLAPITSLPGCNPIWPVDARTKPSCKSDQMPMQQPDSRVVLDEWKIALPIVTGAGSAKVAAGSSSSSAASTTSTTAAATSTTAAATTTSASGSASVASATDSDSSSSAPASSASASTTGYADPYNYGVSASGSSSSSAAPTTSASTTGYEDPYVYGSPSGSSSSGSSSAAAAAATTSASESTGYTDTYVYGSPAGTSTVSGSSSAAPTTSASTGYEDPYSYGAPAGSSSSSSASVAAAATTTSASQSAAYTDTYAYGSPAGTTTSGSSSVAPTTSASTTGYEDPYAYGAPAAGSSSSSSSASVAAAAATTSASQSAAYTDTYVYAAPAGSSSSSVQAAGATSAPGTTSTAAAHANSSPSKTKSMNPPASTASGATPTPQNANAVASPKPQKTCAHRKHKNHHHGNGNGHRRRDWRKRIVN